MSILSRYRIPHADYLFLLPGIRRVLIPCIAWSLFAATPSSAQVNYSNSTTPLEFSGSSTGLTQVGDFNGDGFVDVVMQLSGAGGSISYFQNNGSGTFSQPGTHPFTNVNAALPSGYTLSTSVTTVADYDCDGDFDLWTRVSGAGNDLYLRNDAGTMSVQTSPLEFSGSSTGLAQVGDFNGDGFVDVVMQLSGAGGSISYFQNNGSGTFSQPGTHPFTNINAALPSGYTLSNAVTTVADYDGDGDFDIWTRVSGSANDVYFRNDGGTMTIQTSPLDFSGSTTGLTQIGDFNGDGSVDVIMQLSGGASSISYFQNNGSGTFSQPGTHPFTNFNTAIPSGFTLSTSLTSVADYDGDGDFDLWTRVLGASNDLFLSNSGTAPSLTSAVPASNATNVAVNANIVLTFSENVSVGSGNIYIRRLSDNVAVHTLPANGAAVTGGGTSVLTIDPPANLATSTTYYLSFDRNAISDVNDGFIFGRVDPTRMTRMPFTSNAFLRFTTATSALPLSLLSFKARLAGSSVLLEWETAREVNTSHFVIEHSTDAKSWSVVGLRHACGSSSGLQRYQYEDGRVLSGFDCYRLRMVDLDGSSTLSGVEILRSANPMALVQLHPNPAQTDALLTGMVPGSTVQVVGTDGRVFQNEVVSGSQLTLSAGHLPPGQYYIHINDNQHPVQVLKLVRP